MPHFHCSPTTVKKIDKFSYGVDWLQKKHKALYPIAALLETAEMLRCWKIDEEDSKRPLTMRCTGPMFERLSIQRLDTLLKNALNLNQNCRKQFPIRGDSTLTCLSELSRCPFLNKVHFYWSEEPFSNPRTMLAMSFLFYTNNFLIFHISCLKYFSHIYFTQLFYDI